MPEQDKQQDQQFQRSLAGEVGRRYGSAAIADLVAVGVTTATVAAFSRLVSKHKREQLNQVIARKIVMPLLDKGEGLAETLMEKSNSIKRGKVTEEDTAAEGANQQVRMEDWKSLSREERAQRIADVIIDIGVTIIPGLATRVGMQYALDRKWVQDTDTPYSRNGGKGLWRVGWMQIPDKATSAVSMVGIHMYAPKLEKESIGLFSKLFKTVGQTDMSAKANGALVYAHLVNTLTGNAANAAIMTGLNRWDRHRWLANQPEGSVQR